MADAPPSAVDAAALIAEIRRGDDEAIRQAYKLVFGWDMGRLVLAHHMSECGVGNTLGREGLEYTAGGHDAALNLASKAGFDQASIAVAVLTDELQGDTDGPAFNYTPPDDDDFG